jgi:hypothetical protein
MALIPLKLRVRRQAHATTNTQDQSMPRSRKTAALALCSTPPFLEQAFLGLPS